MRGEPPEHSNLLVKRGSEYGPVVDVGVKDEVGGGVADRQVVPHQLALVGVVGGLDNTSR